MAAPADNGEARRSWQEKTTTWCPTGETAVAMVA